MKCSQENVIGTTRNMSYSTTFSTTFHVILAKFDFFMRQCPLQTNVEDLDPNWIRIRQLFGTGSLCQIRLHTIKTQERPSAGLTNKKNTILTIFDDSSQRYLIFKKNITDYTLCHWYRWVKGTVKGDFRPPVSFIIRTSLGHWPKGKNSFKFGYVFAELFEF